MPSNTRCWLLSMLSVAFLIWQLFLLVCHIYIIFIPIQNANKTHDCMLIICRAKLLILTFQPIFLGTEEHKRSQTFFEQIKKKPTLWKNIFIFAGCLSFLFGLRPCLHGNIHRFHIVPRADGNVLETIPVHTRPRETLETL